jgi:flagellar assembly factor FliW
MTRATATKSSLKTRFGQLDLRSEQILNFTAPIIGFDKLRRYAVLPSVDRPPLLWLQSADEGEVAFPVLDPYLVFPDYQPKLPPLQTLMQGDGPYQLLCVLGHEGDKFGLNLLAPIVVCAARQLAAQIILQQSDLKTFRALGE